MQTGVEREKYFSDDPFIEILASIEKKMNVVCLLSSGKIFAIQSVSRLFTLCQLIVGVIEFHL